MCSHRIPPLIPRIISKDHEHAKKPTSLNLQQNKHAGRVHTSSFSPISVKVVVDSRDAS